jgi:hypothetical protein
VPELGWGVPAAALTCRWVSDALPTHLLHGQTPNLQAIGYAEDWQCGEVWADIAGSPKGWFFKRPLAILQVLGVCPTVSAVSQVSRGGPLWLDARLCTSGQAGVGEGAC